MKKLEDKEILDRNKLVLCLVGMPGAGKTESVFYLRKKNLPFVRFGDVTDEGIRNLGQELTPDNERAFREKLRQELGMAAYAIRSKPKIDRLLETNDAVVIDGLYSWEEYILLSQYYQGIKLVHIFAEPEIRYQRLAGRKIRPLSLEEARKRDIAEIENLDKGGPIAIADYLIENNKDDIKLLYTKIDSLLTRLGTSFSSND
ncbi:AAA family ATPase [Patescibacteria group bacterium]|nr:AAA family ATPase [Patescibacteria group bacterium]MCL5010550.1 AAA family ATPase [Patescibacteria group bacterium]